ncbi:stressosome-associated protein Prli42 [Halobacillus sp. A1]|nr:stressosome-associated protein Prli42 [Halobacillus sp. A1]MCP3032945.1 stressosome-associated protein Prli42 [Halobacillus sp. A1]
MANQNQPVKKKKSKREKRTKFVIYLMIVSMVLSTLLAGASFFL